MKRLNTLLALAMISLAPAACTGDDSGDDGVADGTDGSSGDTGGDDTTGNMPPVTTTPAPTTITETTTGGSSDGDTDETADTGIDDTTGEDPTTGGAVGYDFNDTPPDEMTPIDRMGMPAITTSVIDSDDAYNADTPVGDIAGTYVPEIIASLEFLHGALDDDLMGAGLVPCAVDDCVAQAAPLVVPDVLAIDPDAPAGFPNGRLLADPVVDVTLAVVLLDLTAMGQDALTLAGLPLNPPANDVPFEKDFPFLAPAH